MRQHQFLYYALMVISLASCTRPDQAPQSVEGWAPVYQQPLPDQEIQLIAPQPVQKGGKIYVKNNFLYQAEEGMGIHVVNIENPGQPTRLGFIPIAGVREIAIRDQFLYANNFNDLLILDISDLEQIHLVKRLENTFHMEGGDLPPEPGYFECVDPSKGIVVGWKKKLLQQPKCKY